jgi:hypothetical protein
MEKVYKSLAERPQDCLIAWQMDCCFLFPNPVLVLVSVRSLSLDKAMLAENLTRVTERLTYIAGNQAE